MKKARVVYIIFAAVCLLGSAVLLPLAASAQAQFSVTQLTNTTDSKSIVASSGDKVVWMDSNGYLHLYDGTTIRNNFAANVLGSTRVESVGMDAENIYYSQQEVLQQSTSIRYNIYRYNITTSQITPLTFDTVYESAPYKNIWAVEDGRVFWTKTNSATQQDTLQVYDIASGTIQDFFLTDIASNVAIDGPLVAYAKGSGCATATLVVRNLDTNDETPLSSNKCAGEVFVSGQFVSWLERNLQANTYRMMLYDGTATTLLEEGPFVVRSEMNGNKLVWETCQAAECSVRVHDTSSGTTETIANAGNPGTNGTIVMWRELRTLPNGTQTFVPKIKDYSTSEVAYLNSEGWIGNETTSYQKYAIDDELFGWVGSKTGNNRNQIVIARPATTPQDTTPPTVTGTPNPLPNGNGWNNTNVTVNWTATDPVPSSGTPTQPGQTVATQEGTHTYASGQSCDPAGNCSIGTMTLSIDKSLPTTTNVVMTGLISFTVPILNITISFFPPNVQNTTITANVADAVSGVTAAEYYFDNQAPAPMNVNGGTVSVTTSITSLPSGVHALNVRSQDAAGNWSIVASKTFIK